MLKPTLCFIAAALTACGGSSGNDPVPTDPGPTLAARATAATTTAQSGSNACQPIRPFYWEVGDGSQRQASGSVMAAGSATSITADTPMLIASASKWLYGAYVAERRNGALTALDIQFLTFRSGYTSFGTFSCDSSDTVGSCVARGSNSVQTLSRVNRFNYDGGHMQVHANLAGTGDMGLGALGSPALAAEVRSRLGTDIALSYSSPQPPGGVFTTAANYALFLRKVVNGQLRMSSLLGSNAVCTNPATCPTADYTPVPASQSWHYSIGHWVETSGDGAFSSAGAFGFYPWVDASKRWYGVVARSGAFGSGNESADCGALIRRAWVTGTAQ